MNFCRQSNNYYFFIWRTLAVGCLCAILSMVSTASAQQAGVSIDSFSVIKTSPEFVDIELVVSNDGSMESLALGAIAKSKDGSIRSKGYAPIFLPVGQKLPVKFQILRPEGDERPLTDSLMVFAYQGGKTPLLSKKFDWSYIWPEMSKKLSRSAVDEPTDLGTRNPWWVFFQNLQEEDFFALDAIMEKWNNPKERDMNGDWKLDSFRSVFVSSSVKNKDWKGSLQRIQKWRAFNKKSPGAAIAEAKHWAAYAWHIQGGQYIKDVDPVAIKVFRERMQRAEQVLKKSKSFASNNPLWYETYLDIAVATRRDEKFVVNLFDESIRRHPYFVPLYTNMAMYWAPWNPTLKEKSDWRKISRVVNQAVSLTSDIDGITDYARIYAQLDSRQDRQFDIFRNGLVPWARMRDSFEELVKRYPSKNNLNEFAGFACHAGDKATFLKIRAKIKGRVVPGKWSGNYSPDLCDHRFLEYS